ncbi:MAG: hypothetical protein U0324_01890 [Polyangiales bacterium]
MPAVCQPGMRAGSADPTRPTNPRNTSCRRYASADAVRLPPESPEAYTLAGSTL